jgi:hypothetical protein
MDNRIVAMNTSMFVLNADATIQLNAIYSVVRDINLTTKGMSQYMTVTLYPAIVQNQQYLINVLSNQSLTLQELAIIKQNVSTNSNKLDIVIGLIDALNQTVITQTAGLSSQISNVSLELDSIGVIVTWLQQQVNLTINPSLITLQSNLTAIQNTLSTMQSGDANIMSNLTYLQGMVTSMNSSLHTTMLGLDGKLDAINIQAIAIEEKLDCNHSVNILCDKIDEMLLNMQEMNSTLNYIGSSAHNYTPELNNLLSILLAVNLSVNDVEGYLQTVIYYLTGFDCARAECLVIVIKTRHHQLYIAVAQYDALCFVV